MGALKRVLTQGLIFIAALHGGYSGQTKASFFERVNGLDNFGPAPGDVVEERKGMSASTCVSHCAAADWCASTFYDPSRDLCHLLAVQYFASDGLESAVGWQFWRAECPLAMGYRRDPVSDLCIRLAAQTSVTYDEAKAACMDDNSELINLDSMDKFLALTNFIESSGIDSGMSGGRRVAGHRPTDGGLFDFVLENGEPFPFREDSPAWKLPNQPNDSGGDQDCLGLSLRFLLLKDWECAPSSAVTGFICERLLRLN